MSFSCSDASSLDVEARGAAANAAELLLLEDISAKPLITRVIAMMISETEKIAILN